MDLLFHVLDDATVILRNKKGVYRQAKVYSRGDKLYASLGTGFIRLLQVGTSNPDVSWEDLSDHPNIAKERLGPAFKKTPLRKAA